MIFINKIIFYNLLVGLIITFSLFTAFYMESDNFNSGTKFRKINIESTAMGGKGYYDTRIESGFSPGIYRVSVHPIGENVTIFIRSYCSSVEKNVNGSNTDEISFKMKMGSAVWQGVLIGDAPDINFSEQLKVMTITYDKIEDEWESSTLILLGISGAGGVTFAANEARIYRKKRQ